MSLVNLANVCSHLQNASLARLGLTSIPHSRMHLSLSIQLQKQGFLSNVVLGGPTPPRKLLPPTGQEAQLQFQKSKDQEPVLENVEAEASEPFAINELFPASNLHPASQKELRKEAHQTSSVVTQANRASRRLWLGLKYWDGEPVMRKMKMLSKPTQRLWLTHDDLSKIVRGKRANYVEGLTRIGECLFISTDKGVMEARECVERRIGGLVLCRVYG
ncbi:37S ribosomal protein S8 [Elsinoe australis]|uniref:37S ribosomal protein S8 n=1 Tax=Elsinoe australis TaxID=40998 RepID=A0A4U7AL24_9PEZI|nr:37S ribosomal protein S8 [Elsinoe australis]